MVTYGYSWLTAIMCGNPLWLPWLLGMVGYQWLRPNRSRCGKPPKKIPQFARNGLYMARILEDYGDIQYRYRGYEAIYVI